MTNGLGFRELFAELMALSDAEDTPFYHVDQERNGERYRIFSYHFTDRDSWLRPSALEARGIMFRLDEFDRADELVSRPMEKFFNKGEVDFIDYAEPQFVMDKVDGSLISSYRDRAGNVRLKSKTSVTSDYALYAEELLNADPTLLWSVTQAEKDGYTVNMELVSPDPFYRIVVFYDRPRLVVLNARNRHGGFYMSREEIERRFPWEHVVEKKSLSKLDELDTAVGIEGYVVVDRMGNWWKEKCRWYLERHRAKDFINSPRAFAELVLKEEADDVYQLMADQPGIVEQMKVLQHKVVSFANKVVNDVTTYYLENKHLSRKDYAIKAKEQFTDFQFGLVMMFYTKEPDWQGMLLKQVKKMEFDGDEIRLSS